MPRTAVALQRAHIRAPYTHLFATPPHRSMCRAQSRGAGPSAISALSVTGTRATHRTTDQSPTTHHVRPLNYERQVLHYALVTALPTLPMRWSSLASILAHGRCNTISYTWPTTDLSALMPAPTSRAKPCWTTSATDCAQIWHGLPRAERCGNEPWAARAAGFGRAHLPTTKR